MENGQEKHEILQFRGSMFLSLVPVVIFFCFLRVNVYRAESI